MSAGPSTPKALPGFMKPYVGNRHLFSFLKKHEATNATVANCNSVLNIAPTFKWALSIVPLMGLFTGNPPVEKLDLGQTVALFSTGVVWSFYATIIRPQWMVTVADLPSEITVDMLKKAGEAHGITDTKIVQSGGKSQAVFAFADNEKAASLLKQGLKVGETSLTTGTSGLTWFNKMLPGSRALFMVNCALAVVHGWNLRRAYVHKKLVPEVK